MLKIKCDLVDFFLEKYLSYNVGIYSPKSRSLMRLHEFINFLLCSIKICLNYQFAPFWALQYFSSLVFSDLSFKVQHLGCMGSGFKSDVVDDFC